MTIDEDFWKRPILITADVGGEKFSFSLIVNNVEQKSEMTTWHNLPIEFRLPIRLNQYDTVTYSGYLERINVPET